MAGRLTAAARLSAELRALPLDEWRGYLREHSGLPGPRGNLELADAFAAEAPAELIRRLADSDDEYERFCGTQGLGRLLLERHDAGVLALLHERASDPRWRVREAAARALQAIGDRDPDATIALVERWVTSDDPYVIRAAVAGICEPRLLNEARTRATALSACQTATRWIERLPRSRRAEPAVRTLRQALGYCWSVAIAADPANGLAMFAPIRSSGDVDLQWVARTNLGKARLKRVISAGPTAL